MLKKIITTLNNKETKVELFQDNVIPKSLYILVYCTSKVLIDVQMIYTWIIE